MFSISCPDAVFDKFIAEAMNEPFSGWDFSYITGSGRMIESPLKWNYPDMIEPYARNAETLLDIDTGGGELLSGFKYLPPGTYATESYLPNVEVARKRLMPLGIEVAYVRDDLEPPYNAHLPYEDAYFDLVINRHSAYSPSELKRILKKAGIFITQQVGCFSAANLMKDMVGGKVRYGNWNLFSAIKELEKSGFDILEADEQMSTVRFSDIGAIVYYFKAIPWLIDGFNPADFHDELVFIHRRIIHDGYYETLNHRFVITAMNIQAV